MATVPLLVMRVELSDGLAVELPHGYYIHTFVPIGISGLEGFALLAPYSWRASGAANEADYRQNMRKKPVGKEA